MVEFRGCVFTGNTAAGTGGALFNNGVSPVLTNCTFSSNSSGISGAITNINTSNPTFTNCILRSNTPSEIFDDGSSLSMVTFSNIEAGFAGTGNIDADPKFVDADGLDDVPGTEDDDLRLDRFSPCIDAGGIWVAGSGDEGD